MMERGKIVQKIENLLRLASNNPSEEEAKAALLKAQELMLKYHIDNPETIEVDRVVTVCHELGSRRKTEFVLMLSVVAAQYFRSKTVHYGNCIYFLGFQADALAAKEVFSYVLKYGDSAHDEYFTNTTISRQADINWRYGFVVGLHNAFASRKGYELMTMVPDKVEKAFESIKREQYRSEKDCNISGLDGAFVNGFSTGKDALEKREIKDCHGG